MLDRRRNEAFEVDAGDVGGTLSGKNLEWYYEGSSYEEIGVWTFIDPTTCVKSSRWEENDGSNGGDCWGLAYKNGTPPPIPLPTECI